MANGFHRQWVPPVRPAPIPLDGKWVPPVRPAQSVLRNPSSEIRPPKSVLQNPSSAICRHNRHSLRKLSAQPQCSISAASVPLSVSPFLRFASKSVSPFLRFTSKSVSPFLLLPLRHQSHLKGNGFHRQWALPVRPAPIRPAQSVLRNPSYTIGFLRLHSAHLTNRVTRGQCV